MEANTKKTPLGTGNRLYWAVVSTKYARKFTSARRGQPCVSSFFSARKTAANSKQLTRGSVRNLPVEGTGGPRLVATQKNLRKASSGGYSNVIVSYFSHLENNALNDVPVDIPKISVEA